MEKTNKFRHNKKRNVLFLYEALVRTVTKAILVEDKEMRASALAILKEHFCSGTLLHDEITLYRALHETYGLSRKAAERLLSEVLRVYSTFDQDELVRQQNALVSKINKAGPKKLYSTFVPSYRNLASLYQIFKSKKLSIQNRVLLEEKIIESLMMKAPEEKEAEKMETTDNLSFKMFVRAFNEQCGGLLSEQKVLLQRFISASGDQIEFRAYLNEEIGRLREKIPALLKVKEIVEDPVMLERAKGLPEVLDQFKTEREVTSLMLETLLRVQQLIAEAIGQ